MTGSHAAALSDSIHASRTRSTLLGGISPYDDSSPLEVRDLDPIRVFRAELTSRSCNSPQLLHTQNLTGNPLIPRGPVKARQGKQVTVVFLSLVISNGLPACWLSSCRKPLSAPQHESSTDLPRRVRTSFRLLTSPTTIF